MKNIIAKYTVPAGVFGGEFKVVHNIYRLDTIVRLTAVFTRNGQVGTANIIHYLIHEATVSEYPPLLVNSSGLTPWFSVAPSSACVQFHVKPTAKTISYIKRNSASSTCDGMLSIIEEYDMHFERGEYH